MANVEKLKLNLKGCNAVERQSADAVHNVAEAIYRRVLYNKVQRRGDYVCVRGHGGKRGAHSFVGTHDLFSSLDNARHQTLLKSFGKVGG